MRFVPDSALKTLVNREAVKAALDVKELRSNQEKLLDFICNDVSRIFVILVWIRDEPVSLWKQKKRIVCCIGV